MLLLVKLFPFYIHYVGMEKINYHSTLGKNINFYSYNLHYTNQCISNPLCSTNSPLK